MFPARNLRWSWSCLLHTCSYYLSAKNQTNLPINKQIFLIFRYLSSQLSSAANSMSSRFNMNLSFALIRCPMIWSGNPYHSISLYLSYLPFTYIIKDLNLNPENWKWFEAPIILTRHSLTQTISNKSDRFQYNIVHSFTGWVPKEVA